MTNLFIAENRTAFADIVCLSDTPQTHYAAEELRYYFNMMTGAEFKIRSSADAEIGKCFVRLNQTDDPAWKFDGFRLKTDDCGLEISGGIRGIIYGVYEFLERLGCRFFTPLDEKIPVCLNLELPAFDETQIPILEYRMHDTRDMSRYQRFAVKSRINGYKVAPKLGGGMPYVWFVHSMNQIIPQEEFGKSHPEYFSMRDGKRYLPENPACGQRCLTNPDVKRIAVERVRAALLAHPECQLISLSQLDNGANCTCDECRKTDLEEGSPSGTMLRFVNHVANALRNEFPNVVFDTLAYQYTRPVAHKTKPAPNVCVRLCSIECCFSHPMGKCSEDRSVERPDGSRSDFVTDLTDWGKTCNRMYIWDYVTCFSHYPTPHPNWHTLQPNMQLFVKNNVKGVFEQGNSKLGGGPDLVELRQYLIAKLLWDPYCDLERHMTEFLEYYYGDAAPFVREYIEAVCGKCEKDNIHVGFNDVPKKAFVTEDMLDVYDAILARAEAAVYGNPLYQMRIKKIQFCPRYLRLKRQAMLQGKVDVNELNKFFTDWRSYGFTRIHEWVSAETALRAFLNGVWRGEELLDFWMGEGGELL